MEKFDNNIIKTLKDIDLDRLQRRLENECLRRNKILRREAVKICIQTLEGFCKNNPNFRLDKAFVDSVNSSLIALSNRQKATKTKNKTHRKRQQKGATFSSFSKSATEIFQSRRGRDMVWPRFGTKMGQKTLRRSQHFHKRV